jgi:hypothetical protein
MYVVLAQDAAAAASAMKLKYSMKKIDFQTY